MVPDARNSFKSCLRGTVYVSLFNAEVIKTVTSLLRLFSFFPDFLVGGLAILGP